MYSGQETITPLLYSELYVITSTVACMLAWFICWTSHSSDFERSLGQGRVGKLFVWFLNIISEPNIQFARF